MRIVFVREGLRLSFCGVWVEFRIRFGGAVQEMKVLGLFQCGGVVRSKNEREGNNTCFAQCL